MNTYFVLLTLICILLVASLSVQVSGSVKAWYTPSTFKVMRDAKLKRTSKWKLYAAKNEVEACQLVLLSSKPVDGVRVYVSDLEHTQGNGTLSAKLFKVEYVPITEKNIPYPDPLPPLMGTINLQANQAQPVWISIRVPKDAARGLYTGEAIVEVAGVKTSYPLSIGVWNFALPDTPSSDTAFGIYPTSIARAHGVKDNSPELAGLVAKYYEMLLDHRVSAYNIPVDLMSKDAEKYLNDPRMTSFCIPYPDDDTQMQQTAAKLRAGGWFKKGYYYPIDEPFTQDSFTKFTEIINRLKRVVPDYRITTPFYRHPDFGNKDAYEQMTGSVNIWCPNSNFFDIEPKTNAYLTERRKAGEKTWWYVCCGPGDPYNNYFITMSAVSHRLLMWQQKRFGIQGLLYWSTTYWESCIEPWSNMMTVPDINKNIFGDGSLMYPGKKVGIDGPVSSLRLEMVREGLEDFDYLTIADKVLGPEVTMTYITRIARSLTDYEKDPSKLESVRKELGTAIERANKP